MRDPSVAIPARVGSLQVSSEIVIRSAGMQSLPAALYESRGYFHTCRVSVAESTVPVTEEMSAAPTMLVHFLT